MVAAEALMPISSLLPVATGADSRAGTSFRHVPDRFREAVVFKVYSPDEASGLYGSSGENVVIQKTGQLIDLYL